MKTESLKATTINFAVYGIKVDGEIDRDATIAKFTTDLDSHIELQAKDQPALTNALEELFSTAGNTKLQKKAVVGAMLQKVGFTTATYTRLEERANAVIDGNDRYYAQLGAGGGIGRMNDKEYAHFQETGLNPSQVSAANKKAAKELKAAAKAKSSS